MANLASQSGPQDVSQLTATLNSLISQLNGFLSGTSAQTWAIQNGTTAANLPGSGMVVLASTVASAAYKLPAPTVGSLVRLLTKSTLSQTVTLVSGNFFKNRTKLTFKTTNVGLPQSMSLLGISTSVWAILSASGTPKCT